MFGRKNEIPQETIDEIRHLSKRVAELKGTLDGGALHLEAQAEVQRLKREVVDLQIQRDKINEGHAREKREIEHSVGLHKKQVELDLEIAKREASVTVREENLDARQARFTEQVSFLTDRMTGEVDRMNSLMNHILERLPKVEALIGHPPPAETEKKGK